MALAGDLWFHLVSAESLGEGLRLQDEWSDSAGGAASVVRLSKILD
jgi:hypothetical protein